MTVRIDSSSRRGSSAGAVHFEDPLAGVDQPFGIGNDWWSQFSSSAAVTQGQLDGNVNRGGSGLTFGPTQMVTRCKFFPVVVDNVEIRRLSLQKVQFSKWTHVLSVNGGGSCNVGVSVFGEANRGNEYLLDRVVTGNVTLWRDLANSGVTLISNVFAVAAGDSFAIQASYAPAANTIYCFKNDILQATFVDSSPVRPSGGLFGITYFGNGAGSNSQTYINYSGGFID